MQALNFLKSRPDWKAPSDVGRKALKLRRKNGRTRIWEPSRKQPSWPWSHLIRGWRERQRERCCWHNFLLLRRIARRIRGSNLRNASQLPLFEIFEQKKR